MLMKYESLARCKNYFIQLFYKTGKRYSCTRTKLGKLLSILAFKYAANDKLLFFEEIYRYPNCGTAIKELMCGIERDVYREYAYEDGKKRIHKHELKANVDIPKMYPDISLLKPEIKKDIEDVFFNFGAYSQSDLSDVLNPIVEYEGICNSEGIIELEKIILLHDKLPGNKVLDYIFNR